MKKELFLFCIQFLIFSTWMSVAVSAQDYDVKEGPTGLTIEVPTAGTSGPEPPSSYLYRASLYDNNCALTYMFSVSTVKLNETGASISLLKDAWNVPIGISVEKGNGPIALMFSSSTINTDLPFHLKTLQGACAKPFVLECADLLEDLVIDDALEPPTVSSKYRAFLDHLFYMISAELVVSNQNINDLVTTWEDVNDELPSSAPSGGGSNGGPWGN